MLLSPPEYATFYMLMNLMMGESWDTAKKEVAKKLPTTLAFATAFWIPMQIINFKYVSPRMRVVFVAGCTFLEFNMLAFLKNMKTAPQGDEKDPVIAHQHQEPQPQKTSSIVHHEPHVALVETVTSTCSGWAPVCAPAPPA